MKQNLVHVSRLVVGLFSLFSMGGANVWALSSSAPDQSLDMQLQGLNLPSNEAPTQVSTEKLYAVQSRYVPVNGRSELGLSFGNNFAADSYITSGQFDLSYRYHVNDKWHLTAEGSYVYNSLSGSGQRLLDMNELLPDVAYVKYRGDLLVGYNLFYGKFRVSMDQVFYFDQYVAVGPGVIAMENGKSAAAVADVGFVFWMGRKFNAQLGLKDYYYSQKRELSSGSKNDMIGHIGFGILLGGDHT